MNIHSYLPDLSGSLSGCPAFAVVQRKVGMERWSEVRSIVLALPLQVVAADQRLAEAAGALKAAKKMSLVDCFAAALVQQHAAVYTGAPDFKAVAKEIKVVWL